MKFKLLFALLLFATTVCFPAARYVISTDSNNNVTTISFTNKFFEGVCTVEGREGKRWVPLKNFFTTQFIGQVSLTLPTNYAGFRLKCVAVGPGNAFNRLAQVYGMIHTVAGTGGGPVLTNAWLPEYEGDYATNVVLSDPRYAMADEDGNIYVVERAGHAVDKITPDGRIHTFIGTHTPGDSGQLPGQTATSFPLRSPSAIYITSGSLFVLDAGNNRIVKVDLEGPAAGVAGIIQYDFTTNGVGAHSAGLWVEADLDNPQMPTYEAYFGSGTELKHLEDNVVSVAASGFVRISHVTVDPRGRIIVSDSADNRVYRARGTGLREPVAGTGLATGPRKAEDVLDVALPGASSVWFLPITGYLISLDQGAKIYYVDSDDQAAPVVFGLPGTHAGDGEWFRKGGKKPKISNALSVSLAPNGDMIIVEGNGYVRKIDFLRRKP
ncbi:MAG TPA: hypothetical protein VNT99_02670 [Methylomirabilota bacterium]|nr:hypothetical protein [Methylomirabilota bacterium]